MIVRSLAAITAFGALSCVAAGAQVLGPRGARAEIQAYFVNQLRAADENADGVVSVGEWATLPVVQVMGLQRGFGPLDTTRDGVLDETELEGAGRLLAGVIAIGCGQDGAVDESNAACADRFALGTRR